MESISANQVYAVVVWFHPTAVEVEAIRLYRNEVAGVIVVDNSDTDNRALLADDPSVTYMPLLQNRGIAAALNVGCRWAQEAGAVWVLTMDQDSRWDQHSVTQYIAEANRYEQLSSTAIFSPFQDCDGRPDKHHRHGRYEQRQVVMCSGNLLRLSAWQEVNGFQETFFIDYVDDEICCHVRNRGWQVVRTNNILLSHSLGNGVQTIGATRHIYVAHPAWRYYYIARNARRMQQLYPTMRKYYAKQLRKYVKRLLLYDWNDKWNKLREFLRGLHEA